jgi:putative ABC transport system substrate-binding protein
MTRREFITLIGGATVAWPIGARGQPPSMPMVGFLNVGFADRSAHQVAAFRQGLKETGYIEGRNITVEFRWADGRYDRLPTLAADLIRREAAVILTGGGEAPFRAVRAASETVPIVFNIGNDPVQLGLVASLAKPGGNATGVNFLSVEIAAKRLQLLNSLVPTSSIIAVLVNPNFPATESSVSELESAARVMGRQVEIIKATNESELDATYVTISQMRAGALMVGNDPFFTSRRAQIVAVAARLAIPAIYEQREFALAGGLISYGTSIADSYRQLGVYVGRILKGEKAGDLPVLQPTKFELVINLGTARAFGFTLPPSLLAIADEVIE